ncbi:MAG: 30S ribosomal protein S8 [bacterium]
MPVTDTVSDFLTRIRNAAQARHKETEIPASKLKLAIAKILKEQGYISDYEFINDNLQGKIKVTLRYYKREPAIRELKKISKPGRRIYAPAGRLPRVKNGLGIAIISTSKGVMTDKQARVSNVGGEILCTIW